MTGLEPRICGVRSDRSTNCTTATVLPFFVSVLKISYVGSNLGIVKWQVQTNPLSYGDPFFRPPWTEFVDLCKTS